MKFNTSFSLPLSILLNPVEEVWAGQLCRAVQVSPLSTPSCKLYMYEALSAKALI